MALNIKDPETEKLATQLAERLNTTKTAAIRDALRAQLTSLESVDHERLNQVLDVLRCEIWPLTEGSAPITKQDREVILGYDEDGFST